MYMVEGFIIVFVCFRIDVFWVFFFYDNRVFSVIFVKIMDVFVFVLFFIFLVMIVGFY